MLQKEAINPKFPKLFESGYIGGLQLKNRLTKAPVGSGLATSDGCVTERMITHYRETTQGGVGLVIVEAAYIDDKASKAIDCQLGVSRAAHEPGLQWLASMIKANGARTCLQLFHSGRQKWTLEAGPPKAASRVPWEEIYQAGLAPPEALTFEEIREIVEAFGNAALRAKRCGFDMIEVHGAHGYVVTNFLSPHTNRRTDWYGGGLTNRMRFLLEVFENIVKKVGPDYPLGVRLSGTDYEEEEPITIEETKEVAKALVEAGVSTIHVSGGVHDTMDKEIPPMYAPLAIHVWCAEEIKGVVNIPVIVSGSITTPELAEEILEAGKGDFVSLARPFLADPYFPLKAKEGRSEDIAPCIRCCVGCTGRGGTLSGAINCTVNVAVGRENEFRITLVAKPKKVTVVGGGPAGMEAARVAALRGHKVTLFEKRKLGGMLIEASVPEFKADIRRLINYLSTQVKKAGIKIIEGEATSQIIKDNKPNAVIVAVGATPWVLDVPGINKSSVVQALDVLRGTQTGKNLIVVGGGMIGRDVALFLAEQGKRITITTREDGIVRSMDRGSRQAFLSRLSKVDVEVRTGVYLEEIVDSGIIILDRYGVRHQITGDSVVLATGLIPNRKLFDELTQVPELEVYAVGDCVQPRDIFDAIHEGHWVAHAL